MWHDHCATAVRSLRILTRFEEKGLKPKVAAKTGLIVDVGSGTPSVLYRADIDAITAINADWEAKINSESTSANEMGFTADLSRCKTRDLAETGRFAQVAKLRYQQCRAVALRTELNAGEATKAAEAAEIRLLETARRLATREAVTT